MTSRSRTPSSFPFPSPDASAPSPMMIRDFRAPHQDGAVLAIPPLADYPAQVRANRDHFANRLRLYDFQGRSAESLRTLARREVWALARRWRSEYGLHWPDHLPDADPTDDQAGSPMDNLPIIATGHQPELFHAGVWAKNFAVARAAREQGGIGLNLIVDQDNLKHTSINVPTRNNNANANTDARLSLVKIAFDARTATAPQEDQEVHDRDCFRTFGDRVLTAVNGLVSDPIIEEFWPLVLERWDAAQRPGWLFALARSVLEGARGAANLEVRMSRVCETEAFAWFAAHIFAHLERFQSAHNEALAMYRRAARIRSTHHPVPMLGRSDDWLEAPFWVWRAGQDRRRPLWVRQNTPKTILLRIGYEADPFLELPLGPDRDACCAVERLRTLPDQGIRLRTRALTTTMFIRWFLADLFVHGIGGAIYDVLGDAVQRAFFGVTPPDYALFSQTLRLGIPASADSDSNPALALTRTRRQLRDLTYNPDRHIADVQLPTQVDVAALRAAKTAAKTAPQDTRLQRVHRFKTIRAINEELQPLIADQRTLLNTQAALWTARIREDALIQSREYAFVLHGQSKLQNIARPQDS